MELYLLDTNFASVLCEGLHKEHQTALAFVQALKPEDRLYISRITLAEIEYGFKVYLGADLSRKLALKKAISVYEVRDVDKHTVDSYSDIRAALFRKFAPKDKRGKLTKKRPEELIDKTSARELQIQENDLWIAAIAVQHNMVLVTEDRLESIRQVEPRLRVYLWRSGTLIQ